MVCVWVCVDSLLDAGSSLLAPRDSGSILYRACLMVSASSGRLARNIESVEEEILG